MRCVLHIDTAVTVGTAITVVFRVAENTSCLCSISLYQPIIFALQAAQELEKEDEGDDTDAGAGEYAFGGDVPCRR